LDIAALDYQLHTSSSRSRTGQDPCLICAQVLLTYFGSRCLNAKSLLGYD